MQMPQMLPDCEIGTQVGTSSYFAVLLHLVHSVLLCRLMLLQLHR